MKFGQLKEDRIRELELEVAKLKTAMRSAARQLKFGGSSNRVVADRLIKITEQKS